MLLPPNTVLVLTVFFPVAWGGLDDGIGAGFLAPESAMRSHPRDLRSERWEIVDERDYLGQTAVGIGLERNGGGNRLRWGGRGGSYTGGGDDWWGQGGESRSLLLAFSFSPPGIEIPLPVSPSSSPALPLPCLLFPSSQAPDSVLLGASIGPGLIACREGITDGPFVDR